ncbi:hypothetical protein ACU686_40380 [Yinghuangia aomiensis]
MATAPGPRYGVLVNEVRLLSATDAGAWWAQHRPQWEASGRPRIITPAIPGDEVELGPLSREDAEFAAQHLVGAGVPATAVTVRRWAA